MCIQRLFSFYDIFFSCSVYRNNNFLLYSFQLGFQTETRRHTRMSQKKKKKENLQFNAKLLEIYKKRKYVDIKHKETLYVYTVCHFKKNFRLFLVKGRFKLGFEFKCVFLKEI